MKQSMFLLGVLMIGGCALESAGDATEVSNIPRITLNQLSPDQLAHGALIATKLDATSAAAMGQSADARAVLSYAVTCALDATQSIAFTVSGIEYSETGLMGLAPGWTSGALSASDAAWLSACLFSRVNLTSTAVSFSARGTMSALVTTSTELADYQIEEGAFWGNAFTDRGDVAAYSCNGVDQAADDSYGDLPVRQCAQSNGVAGSHLSPCGMNYAGLCSAVCASSAPYANCTFPGGSAAPAVITSFLYGAPQ
jgi:hypothetical protein